MISVPPMERMERRLYSRRMAHTRSTMNAIDARRGALVRCSVGAGWLVAWPARAQYPDRTITMVVPFPPGGVADTVARPVAEALGKELKQTVVIENKAGAGGALGMGQVARAAPDGYTVLMALSSISVLPEADKLFGRRPAFTLNQFKPIARFTADPTVLVVRADAPWKTLGEFLADAKRKPGAFNYGSSGNYGTMHVPMEMLKPTPTFAWCTSRSPAPARRWWRCSAARSMRSPAARPAWPNTSARGACVRWRIGARSHCSRCPMCRASRASVIRCKFAQWSGLFVPARHAGRRGAETARRRAQGGRRHAGAADDPHRRQPGRVPRRAGVPDLLGPGRRGDGRRRAAHRQGRVTRRRQ